MNKKSQRTPETLQEPLVVWRWKKGPSPNQWQTLLAVIALAHKKGCFGAISGRSPSRGSVPVCIDINSAENRWLDWVGVLAGAPLSCQGNLWQLQLLKIWAINSYFHVISICILAPHYLLLSICFKALFKTRFWLWKNLYFRKSVVGTICCFFWHCRFTFLFLSQDWSCCLLTLLWAGYTSSLAVGFRSIQVDTAGLELCFGFFF